MLRIPQGFSGSITLDNAREGEGFASRGSRQAPPAPWGTAGESSPDYRPAFCETSPAIGGRRCPPDIQGRRGADRLGWKEQKLRSRDNVWPSVQRWRSTYHAINPPGDGFREILGVYGTALIPTVI